ncbi:MAG TPA: helix-turn-helix transcriptional regulator [Burkholderiaceae bacterium]|jgi:transcriptional regulator with XRE-family HTH domain
MSNIIQSLIKAREARGWTQTKLSEAAGVSRMTLSRIESGRFDPRLSSLQVIARAMGLEIMVVPAALRQELEGFVQSGGKLLGQAPGAEAPESIVDQIIAGNRKTDE